MRRIKEDGPLFTQRPGFSYQETDMLNTDNQKYIPEVDRCMQAARKIMGHLPPSSALFTIIAAMTLDFAASHSNERSLAGSSPTSESAEFHEPLRKEVVYA